MIFLNTQDQEAIDSYLTYLKSIASLSNMFSSSSRPLIHYRACENLFCKAFTAKNLSREDSAYDVIKNNTAIGIKTFVLKGNSQLEKIAEFNSHSAELRTLKGKKLAKKLAILRNERILKEDRNHKVINRLYHIVGRTDGRIRIYEVPYDLIDLNTIKILKSTKTALKFRDSINEYSFHISKSVLMKRFIVPNDFLDIEVKIIEDPISVLLQKILEVEEAALAAGGVEMEDLVSIEVEELIAGKEYVVLPLYSPEKKASGNEPIVPMRSQLNQWNARGRDRKPGEVYIPVPAKVREHATDFFPGRNTVFNLKLPDGSSFKAKISQENGKALMTNPNDAIAEWLLRRILRLNENELLTYDRLKNSDFDSVKITKISTEEFLIDLAKIDEYEEFIEKLL